MECVRGANKIASIGHKAAKEAFLEGLSEYRIHQAYLSSIGCSDAQLPYPSIIALNEKSAVLHYENKRDISGGKVLLIDAGAMYRGYCADISRTYTATEAPEVFQYLVQSVNQIQVGLCETLAAGKEYKEFHLRARSQLAELLLEVGILRQLSKDVVIEEGLAAIFMPHGLGHPIGLQTHDVSAKQLNAQGEFGVPIEGDPFYALLDPFIAENILTIEPGALFYSSAFEPLSSGCAFQLVFD